MEVFLAGIVQGSIADHKIHDQAYRAQIKEILGRALPGAELYCPIESHPGALDYDDREGRSTFFEHAKMAADADLVIAYVPEASMGTSVEMWEAYNNGRTVLAISPMKENWALRFLADQIFESVEQFDAYAQGGKLQELLGWVEAEPEEAEVEE